MKQDDFWEDYATDLYLLEAVRKWELDKVAAQHRSDFRSFGRGVSWTCGITAVFAVVALAVMYWR